MSAVFEKFSERSIKSVMIAQQEAKNLGAVEVTTEHVLLGLVAEETMSKAGYLNSGLTVEKVKAAVQGLSGKRKPISSPDNIPFSREVRKAFEAATNVSGALPSLPPLPPLTATLVFNSSHSCAAHNNAV